MLLVDIILGLVVLSIPAAAQAMITVRYRKYSEVANTSKLSGFEVARKILDANGLEDMDIVSTPGTLTDHYDPSRKVVRLSQSNFNDSSIAAMAVAAHECGHAIQHKEGYFMMKFRSKLVFPVNLGTKFSYAVIVAGCLLKMVGLINVGIALTALGLLFQLVTLPVEIDASKRAGVQLKKLALVEKEDSAGVKKVLTAAAMTYVAGVLASLLQVIRLVLIFNRRRN